MTVGLFSLVLMSCHTTQGNFAVLSSKNLDITKSYTKQKDPVQASSTKYIIVLFPTGNMQFSNMLNEALENAEQTNNIDFLTNVTVDADSYYIPFIFGKVKLNVNGDGWKLDTKQASK